MNWNICHVSNYKDVISAVDKDFKARHKLTSVSKNHVVALNELNCEQESGQVWTKHLVLFRETWQTVFLNCYIQFLYNMSQIFEILCRNLYFYYLYNSRGDFFLLTFLTHGIWYLIFDFMNEESDWLSISLNYFKLTKKHVKYYTPFGDFLTHDRFIQN